MKKIITFLSVATTIVLFSCSRAGNSDLSSSVSQAVSSGNWKVSLFTDSGNDETSDFNGYSFAFNSGGVLNVSKNGVTTTGSWNIDASSNKFHIDLGAKSTTNPLGELTDDWAIISSNNTDIRLTDDNPASNEFLSFTKN